MFFKKAKKNKQLLIDIKHQLYPLICLLYAQRDDLRAMYDFKAPKEEIVKETEDTYLYVAEKLKDIMESIEE